MLLWHPSGPCCRCCHNIGFPCIHEIMPCLAGLQVKRSSARHALGKASQDAKDVLSLHDSPTEYPIRCLFCRILHTTISIRPSLWLQVSSRYKLNLRDDPCQAARFTEFRLLTPDYKLQPREKVVLMHGVVEASSGQEPQALCTPLVLI